MSIAKLQKNPVYCHSHPGLAVRHMCKGVYLSWFQYADTRKFYERSCLSVKVFLSIIANLANLAQSFFFIINAINE